MPFPTIWGFYAPFESLDQIRRRPPMQVVPAPLPSVRDSVLQLTSPSDRRTIPSNEVLFFIFISFLGGAAQRALHSRLPRT